MFYLWHRMLICVFEIHLLNSTLVDFRKSVLPLSCTYTESRKIPHLNWQQAPAIAAVRISLNVCNYRSRRNFLLSREVLRNHEASNTQMYTPLARSFASQDVENSPGPSSLRMRTSTHSPRVLKMEIVIVASCGMANWIVVRELKGLGKFRRRMELSGRCSSECAKPVPWFQ